jgi:putative colanic acid biosysnthesis UDP-glucose lipid carrier transferase
LSKDLIKEIVKFADNNLIRFKFAMNFQGFLSRGAELEFFNSTPVFTYRKEPLESAWNRFVKRSFDIVFSLLVILFLFPFVIPVVFIIMKITMPGPMFFGQARSGRNNKTFTCLKFRSMTVNRDSDAQQATKHDA